MATTNNSVYTGGKKATRIKVVATASNEVIVNLEGDKKYMVRHLGIDNTGADSVVKVKMTLDGTVPDIAVFDIEDDTRILLIGDVVYPKRGQSQLVFKSYTGTAMVEVVEIERTTGYGSGEF